MRVDIHTHILPGIDDGADKAGTSLVMLDMLKADGVTDVVFTPHFYFRNQDMEAFLEKRGAAYGKIASFSPKNIRMHIGAEVEFSDVSINYESFRRLSIDGGKYVLLELPFTGNLSKDIFPRLEQLIYQTGLYPIIAHVERYPDIIKNPALVAELINIGCLIQVNAGAVIESVRKSLVDALFIHGQVHLIGTDCHNLGSRKPEYQKIFEKISMIFKL